MKIFLEQQSIIEAHNERYARGEESFSLRLNSYSDLTVAEFEEFTSGLTLPENFSAPMAPMMPTGALPDSFDWRDQGAVSSVKHQKQCGSCYAFAGAGLLESHILRQGGAEFDISEQDAVDCSIGKYNNGKSNQGCKGGVPKYVIDYYVKNGLVKEENYPYTSGTSRVNGPCNRPPADLNVQVDVHDVKVQDEDHLAQLLVTKGPIFISICVGENKEASRLFQSIADGIFDRSQTITAMVNHGVILVGYGSENGRDFWIVKNSWGTEFGVEGYARIAKGKNMCNILLAPVVYVE